MKITLSSAVFAILATVAAAQGQFNAASFPPVNAVPPIDSPEVKEWLKGLDFADVPKFPIHTGNPPACPALAQIPADQCWWTCQTCPADDIETCTAPGVWGLTFDDGPTPNTPLLLESLKAHNAKATFFVMGSNVVRNAEVLNQEVADGHHIASHTWSHHPLTTLSNEQIVAELKWTEKAVKDITGLHMKYMRPPYGDIDNRVRAVVKKLGYTVVDWTSDAYDSKDFDLNAGFTEATLSAAVTAMSTTLKAYGANPGTKGVITLEHDLYPVTVEFAKRLLPVAAEAKLQIQTIAQCLNDAHGYQGTPPPGKGNSTNGNKTENGGKGPNVVHPNNAVAASMVMSGGLMAAGLAIAGAALAAF